MIIQFLKENQHKNKENKKIFQFVIQIKTIMKN